MKVMIVEDDPVSRRLLENFLSKWGYDVLSMDNGMKAWEIMQQPDSASMIISDWMMPYMDGLELCGKIRGMERPEYIYFILLTTKADKKDVIKGLESGADDFIAKPFDREELKYRLKIGERIINLEHRIMQLANTDFLTGVLSRRAFMERMEAERARSVRDHKGLSLVLADIDYFKKINDAYGHQIGDLVLQKFAAQLSGITRPYDFVGRYGGEEFVVCLPDTCIEESSLIAERMRNKIEEIQFMMPDSTQFPVRVTASFGVTSFIGNLDLNVDSIIKRADDALYKAKSEGRNRVCRYDQGFSINHNEDSGRPGNDQFNE